MLIWGERVLFPIEAIRAEQREMRIEQVKIQANPSPIAFKPNREDGQPSGNKRRDNKVFQARQGKNKRFMSGQLDEQQWPKCGKCRKKHLGECGARSTGCYKCGKESHFIKDCTLLRDDQKREEPKKTNARVFAITQAHADAGTSVVSGEIVITGSSTYTLIVQVPLTYLHPRYMLKSWIDHQRCCW